MQLLDARANPLLHVSSRFARSSALELELSWESSSSMRVALVLWASSFTTEMQKTQFPMCDNIKESFWKDDEQESSERDDRKKYLPPNSTNSLVLMKQTCLAKNKSRWVGHMTFSELMILFTTSWSLSPFPLGPLQLNITLEIWLGKKKRDEYKIL